MKSKLIQDFITNLVTEMTEMRRQNYYAQQLIEERMIKIKEFEKALTELGLEVDTDWTPLKEYE